MASNALRSSVLPQIPGGILIRRGRLRSQVPEAGRPWPGFSLGALGGTYPAGTSTFSEGAWPATPVPAARGHSRRRRPSDRLGLSAARQARAELRERQARCPVSQTQEDSGHQPRRPGSGPRASGSPQPSAENQPCETPAPVPAGSVFTPEASAGTLVFPGAQPRAVGLPGARTLLWNIPRWARVDACHFCCNSLVLCMAGNFLLNATLCEFCLFGCCIFLHSYKYS